MSKASSLDGRGVGDQVHILAPHRREHTVVGVDAVERRRAQCRHLHALLAPFVRAQQAQQLAQRGDRPLARGRAPGLGAGLAPVGRAAQRDAVVTLERDQDGREHTGTLGLCLAVQVKGLCRCRHRQLLRRPGSRLAGLALGPAHQRLQQVARVLEVALPQQACALSRHAEGGVCGQGVIGSDDTARHGSAAFGAPLGLPGLALMGPRDHGKRGRHGILHGAACTTDRRHQHGLLGRGCRARTAVWDSIQMTAQRVKAQAEGRRPAARRGGSHHQALIGRFRRTSSILTPPITAVLAVDSSRLKPAIS